MRWSPFDIVDGDLVSGLRTVCGAGDPTTRNGIAIPVYSCNQNMTDRAMYNSDGDFFIGKTIISLP